MTPLPPGLFVSVAAKGLRFYVSGLESILTDVSISVDSKEVAGGQKSSLRSAHFDGICPGRDRRQLIQVDCLTESRRFT